MMQQDEGRYMASAKQQRDNRDLAYYVTLLRQQLPALREHYGVRFMGIFGSYVRGEQRRGSDLDLLVEFDDRPLTLLQFIALEHYLSDLLEVKVDLVERDTLKPTIGRNILSEVVPL
jgi:predicted nucleotidyltransferase